MCVISTATSVWVIENISININNIRVIQWPVTIAADQQYRIACRNRIGDIKSWWHRTMLSSFFYSVYLLLYDYSLYFCEPKSLVLGKGLYNLYTNINNRRFPVLNSRSTGQREQEQREQSSGWGICWNNESSAGHMDTGVIKFTCQSLYFIGTTLYRHLDDGANCAIYILKGQNVGVAIAIAAPAARLIFHCSPTY